jgi:hypothetical protein
MIPPRSCRKSGFLLMIGLDYGENAKPKERF